MMYLLAITSYDEIAEEHVLVNFYYFITVIKARHYKEFFEDINAKRKGIFQNSVAISH